MPLSYDVRTAAFVLLFVYHSHSIVEGGFEEMS